jgi:hypothetical protein
VLKKREGVIGGQPKADVVVNKIPSPSGRR